MTSRHVTTGVTMAVLCVILGLAAVVGFNTLFAPLPGAEEEPAATGSPSCEPGQVKKGERLRSSAVTVNVYNGGTTVGLAGATLDSFRSRGFQGGASGNAPKGSKVLRAQVWIQEGEEDAGRLVALQMGPRVPVVTREKDLADGIDVVVGNRFRTLVKAPRSVVVKKAESTCS